MSQTFSAVFLYLVLGSATLMVQAQPLIAIDNANPPFMYQHQGQPKGLYPVLLQGVFQRAGITVEIQAMPWKRALMRGGRGELGIGGIYKTASRLAIFDYSQTIFEEKLIVYVRRGTATSFHALSDLYGKRVGVIRGWSYTEALDKALNDGSIMARASGSDEANFKMLALGRLDAVIAIELAGQHIVQQLQLDQVVALQPALSINSTHLVFAKQAKQQALLQRFDQSLEAMRADGSLAELLQQGMANP